jgi:hypothetical protein
MPVAPRVRAGLRGPVGPAGPSTDWRTSGGWIQSRPVGGTSWTNVIALSDLTASISAQAFNFRGTVANPGALPGSGNEAGDAFFIDGTADLYAWNGATWDGPFSFQGPAGNPGADGADGAQGPAGPGLPSGGTTGQVPVKASGDDFDIEWADPAAPGGDIEAPTGATLPARFVEASGGYPDAGGLDRDVFHAVFLGPTDPKTDSGSGWAPGDEWAMSAGIVD